jgi:hypothetical protein
VWRLLAEGLEAAGFQANDRRGHDASSGDAPSIGTIKRKPNIEGSMRSIITLLTVIVCLGIGACSANTGDGPRSPDTYGGGPYGGGSRGGY